MFESIQQPKRSPIWRHLGVLLACLLLLLGSIGGGLAWMLTTPQGMQFLLDQLFAKSPTKLTIEDVSVDPSSELIRPTTWRWNFTQVRLLLPGDAAPDISAETVSMGLPDLTRIQSEGVLHWTNWTLVDLAIDTKQQRPGKPWEEAFPKIHTLAVDTVVIQGGHYFAPKDPPLSEASATGLRGTLNDLVYEIGSRKLSGHGALSAKTIASGSAALTNLNLTTLSTTNSNLTFKGQARFADAPVTLAGVITKFHRHPTVTIDAKVESVRVESAFQAATGHPSPVNGQLAAHLIIHSGGDIPRGGAWMEGDAVLTHGNIPLTGNIRPVLRDLLRIAPYLEFSEDQVGLGKMEGRVRFGRGFVEILNLTYHAEKQDIELHGSLDTEGKDLVIRWMPKRDAETRPGVGFTVYGEGKEVKIRVARKEELLPGWVPENEKRAKRREEHKTLLQKIGDLLNGEHKHAGKANELQFGTGEDKPTKGHHKQHKEHKHGKKKHRKPDSDETEPTPPH